MVVSAGPSLLLVEQFPGLRWCGLHRLESLLSGEHRRAELSPARRAVVAGTGTNGGLISTCVDRLPKAATVALSQSQGRVMRQRSARLPSGPSVSHGSATQSRAFGDSRPSRQRVIRLAGCASHQSAPALRRGPLPHAGVPLVWAAACVSSITSDLGDENLNGTALS